MALYLVQHGKALPKEEDPAKGLSSQGEQEVRRIAETAKNYNVGVRRIEHSPKKRARQTAKIMAEALQPEAGVAEREDIKPLDDVSVIRAQIKPDDDLMLVGHLPFLEKLTSMLLIGAEEPRLIRFQNGGIICLDQEEGSWFIKWTLMPNIG